MSKTKENKSQSRKIIKGKDGYNLLTQIINEKPVYKKLKWEYQRKEKNINDFSLENNIDRIGKWKRGCRNPSCARGFQVLNINGKDYEDLTNKPDLISEKIIETAELFEGKILVQGGHYIPELRDLDFIPNQPLEALITALEFVKILNKNTHKADFLLFINDLHMGENEEIAKMNRTNFIANFSIPNDIKRVILSYLKEVEFDIFVTTERKMMLKLNREKKKLLTKGKLIKSEHQNEYLISKPLLGKENIAIINNAKNNPLSGYIKCLGATSRVLKLAIEMGYNNFIQIYPVCAYQGVKLSYEIVKHLYDADINVINFFTTVTCFSDAKKIKYIPPKNHLNQ